MNDRPQLNETEWALLVNLLEREEQELPPEIHHTRTADMKEELTQRLHMVRALLSRLRTPMPV
jgi:Trp operon repressor